jgi:hypothetical protein
MITGFDFDDDGTDDFYLIHQQRALTAEESKAVGIFIAGVLVAAIGLAVLVAIGFVLLCFTNWVADELSKWTRWDWWCWISLTIVGIPSGYVLAKTGNLKYVGTTTLLTGIPSLTVAAIWSWNAADWVIFAAIVLGLFTIAGGAYLIYCEQTRVLSQQEQRRVRHESKRRLKQADFFTPIVTKSAAPLSSDRVERESEQFPWDDVILSRQDRELQSKHNVERAVQTYGSKAVCRGCNSCGKELAWLYFCSPDWTWELLCGRAGWMAVCDQCNVQVFFECDVMN